MLVSGYHRLVLRNIVTHAFDVYTFLIESSPDDSDIAPQSYNALQSYKLDADQFVDCMPIPSGAFITIYFGNRFVKSLRQARLYADLPKKAIL